MARRKFYFTCSKLIRDTLRMARNKSDQMHATEKELVEILFGIDQKRYYVEVGFKSLRGYCCQALQMTETQSQRIVTLVRRYEPTPQIGQEGSSSLHSEE